MSLNKKSKKYFSGLENQNLFEISHSENSYIFDKSGNKYVDFLMGWAVGNLGWDNDEVREAMGNFEGPEYVHPSLDYAPWGELAEILAKLAPGDLKISYRTTGGSESVDAAMQIASCYTGRSGFLSIEGAYHGNTFAALSVGSSAHRKHLPNLLSDCHKISLPLNKESAEKTEELLKTETIAAFIMEPVLFNLHVTVPEQEFIDTMRKLCKKYSTLFIFDEVASGFGRTGKIFASEHFKTTPDIMCMAKGVSGGYAGIGAVITTEEIADKVKDKVNIYSSFGWHPFSTHATIANLKYFTKHQEELLKNVREMENFFISELKKIKFKEEIEISSKGLAIAVDLKDKDYAKKIHEKCIENGLMLSVQENYLLLLPALIITKDVAKEGLEILKKTVKGL